MFLYTWLVVLSGMIAGRLVRNLIQGRMKKKHVYVQTADRKHVIPLEIFLGLLVMHKILTPEEAQVARSTYCLPDNILERLGLAHKAEKN